MPEKILVTWPISPNRVISMEDMVKALKINLEEWDISKARVNKWDTSMKSKTDDIIISENYQVELHLLPKLQQELKTVIQVLNETLQKDPPKVPINSNLNPTKGKIWMLSMFDTHIDKMDVKNTPIKKKIIKLRDAAYRVIDKMNKYWVERMLKVNWWDYFNSDWSHKTTKGTPQENTVSEYDSWKYWFELEIAIIDMMKEFWEVDLIFAPGNHDWHKLQYLRDMIDVYYKNDDNVNVINSGMDRTYYPWWDLLIWVYHWQDAKLKDLPMIAALENKTKHSMIEIFTWHKHRKLKEDFSWAIVEVLWQAWTKNKREESNWYSNHKPSINWFVFDKKNWREVEFTENI